MKKEGWETNLADDTIPLTLRKILESLKRGEKSTVEVKPDFIKDLDQ